MRLRILRIEPQGGPKGGDRLGNLALLLEGTAEITVRVGEDRVEFDRAAQGRDGFFERASLGQRVSQIVVRPWAKSGRSARARRNEAIASSSQPCCASALPRLLCPSTKSG